ncbi:type II toxin-antitoxin system RelE/ParE family toxin [Pediococcus ethanolidurans]|uniref:Plasmid stabilization system protein ParE n=1 Tax=Pediococcus ethanolidurans TaxID=319653 RepID=A0A1H9SN68_9LACO|nr:hypothetical protein [Pediococcus ethanolidurans]GEN95865.1 hypothetical protein PET01_19150 [Pediococcus ethanolidurans]SER86470.1 Plasmid stabilization system protein ParE [Pediococcus ethanolidurans]
MSYKVEFSNDAIDDLEQLQKYLKNHFGNTSDERVIERLLKVMLSLSNFPNRGRPAKLLFVYLDGYYYLHTRKNTIFYTIDPIKKHVRILRIFSNHEDVLARFINSLN